jgi:lambda repressor-like predicted transcriptional regulator
MELTVTKPFSKAVRDLVLLNPALTRKNGNPDWRKLATLAGIGYESLRKALARERPVSDKIIRAVSKALGVSPEHFFEYRLHRAQGDFNPKVVGFEQALKNARAFRDLRGED